VNWKKKKNRGEEHKKNAALSLKVHSFTTSFLLLFFTLRKGSSDNREKEKEET
jgi:hypothetical protein